MCNSDTLIERLATLGECGRREWYLQGWSTRTHDAGAALLVRLQFLFLAERLARGRRAGGQVRRAGCSGVTTATAAMAGDGAEESKGGEGGAEPCTGTSSTDSASPAVAGGLSCDPSAGPYGRHEERAALDEAEALFAISTSELRGGAGAAAKASHYQKYALDVDPDDPIVVHPPGDESTDVRLRGRVKAGRHAGRLAVGKLHCINRSNPFQACRSRRHPLRLHTLDRIKVKSEMFVGRGWLRNKVLAWLDDPEAKSRILVITGEAGIGKSAFFAQLVDRDEWGIKHRVLAPHVCDAGTSKSLDTKTFVAGLVFELAASVPGFEAALLADPAALAVGARNLDKDVVEQMQPAPLLAMVLRVLCDGAVRTPADGATRLIAIDSLDEALMRDGPAGSSDIVGLLSMSIAQDKWPSWLRVVATSRPEGRVTDRLAGSQPCPLPMEAMGAANLGDVRLYVHTRLLRDKPAAWLTVEPDAKRARQDIVATDAATLERWTTSKTRVYPGRVGGGACTMYEHVESFLGLPDASKWFVANLTWRWRSSLDPFVTKVCDPEETQGIFLYAKYLLDDVRDGKLSPEDVAQSRTKLPGLRTYYFMRFQKQYGGRGHDQKLDRSMEVGSWLREVNECLEDYERVFRDAGADNVGMLCDLDADGTSFLQGLLEAAGAKKLHVMTIASALKKLADQAAVSKAGAKDFKWYKRYVRPIFDVLAASRESVPRALLQRASGLDERDFNDVALKEAIAFCQETGGRYRFVHQTFVEFMRESDMRYCADPKQGHEGVVKAFSSIVETGSDSASCGALGQAAKGYLVRHGLRHVVAAGREGDAMRMFVKLPWLLLRLNPISGLQPVHTAREGSWLLSLQQPMEGDPAEDSSGGESKAAGAGHTSSLLHRAVTLVTRVLQMSNRALLLDWRQITAHLVGRFEGRCDDNEYLVELVKEAREYDGFGVPQWFPAPLSPCLRWAGEPLINTLKGHEDEVKSVAFSPDGRRIVSGSSDNTVRVWDAETGQAAISEPLRGHEGSVDSVVFSADGRHIVSGSLDRTVRAWNAETGQSALAEPLRGHTAAVSSVAVSADGRRIVSGSWDRTVRVWDPQTGEAALGTGEGGHRPWTCGACTLQNATLALCCGACGSKRPSTLRGHTAGVESVAFSPDPCSLKFVSGSADNTVGVWDAAEGHVTLIMLLRGHEGEVTSVAFSPGSQRIVSGSLDQTVRVWDVQDAQTGEALLSKTLQGHTGAVRSVAFSADGQRIVSGSWDKTVRVWNAETEESKVLRGHEDGVNSVALSVDDRHIVSGSTDTSLRVWNAETGQSALAEPLQGHEAGVRRLAFSSDGRKIVSGSLDKTLRVWDADTGEAALREPLRGHTAAVSSVAFSADGRRIVSGSDDTTVRVWCAETGEEQMPVLQGHTGSVRSVAFSPDGWHIVSGSDDNTVRLWGAHVGQASSEPLRTLIGHEGWVRSVAFSPDGHKIVSGSLDKTVRVWDIHTGKAALRLQGHTAAVSSVAFSADGQRIVSGDQKNVRVWHADGSPCGFASHGEESMEMPRNTVSVRCDGAAVLVPLRLGGVPFSCDSDPETAVSRVHDDGGTQSSARVCCVITQGEPFLIVLHLR